MLQHPSLYTIPMEKRRYICPKCGCTEYDISKVFDIQNKRFTAVICRQCGYTEFYKDNPSMGWNIIDFLMRP